MIKLSAVTEVLAYMQCHLSKRLAAFKLNNTWRDHNIVLAWFMASLTCGFASFILFYPGIMLYDSSEQWAQATSGVFDDWHPPLMAIIMRMIYVSCGRGYAPFTALQSILFWSSLFFLSWQLSRSRSIRIVTITLAILCPFFWVMSASLWKDVWTATAVNYLCGTLLLYNERKNVSLLFCSTLILGLTLSFRYNTVSIIPPFIYFFGLQIFLIYKNSSDTSKALRQCCFLVVIMLAMMLMPWGIKKSSGAVKKYPIIAASVFKIGDISATLNNKYGIIDPSARAFIDRVCGDKSFEHLMSVTKETNCSCDIFGPTRELRPFLYKLIEDVKSRRIDVSSEIGNDGVSTIMNVCFSYPRGALSYFYCFFNEMMSTYFELSLLIRRGDQRYASGIESYFAYRYISFWMRHYLSYPYVYFVIMMLCLAVYSLSSGLPGKSGKLNRHGLILLPQICIFYLCGLIALSPVAKWHYIFPIFVTGFLLAGTMIGWVASLFVLTLTKGRNVVGGSVGATER